jgi:hypothetical protein
VVHSSHTNAAAGAPEPLLNTQDQEDRLPPAQDQEHTGRRPAVRAAAGVVTAAALILAVRQCCILVLELLHALWSRLCLMEALCWICFM